MESERRSISMFTGHFKPVGGFILCIMNHTLRMFKICNSFLKRCVLCCVYMYLFIDLKAELILQINLAMIHQCFDICFSCHDIVCCDHTDLFFTHYKSFIFSHGARSVTLSKLVPMICKLLDDQNGQVRFMFFNIIKTTRL